ncbi:hypothetical protein HZB90_04535 [archaeon]|nr:hypothetical protein [archaeon]
MPADFARYDKNLANRRVQRFARRRLECYFPKRDEKFGISTYDRDGEQPFIEVFDRPVQVDTWLGEKAKGIEGLLAVRVRSGSHVGFSDTALAREVYDASNAVKAILVYMPLTLHFDDENQLYLPRGFIQEIQKRR